MSKTIDEKVVEMRFDNKQFESNVQTSMSTLDKLKNSLKFEGATKGLENVGAAAKRFDMSPIGDGVETVKAKFSAFEVVAVTALANLTNSAVNTGKQLIKSLSVDQITSGWDKYEQKTASVQTLMNSTGLSLDEVNGYLEKLMWFSDETSYSFTEMTSALAQMTSSGGDIEKLMPMITGIANATAFAGKGSAEFQSTIRNLAQSYQAGYLQLQDMKSLNLMGTSSKQLKETFISVAESMGVIEKGQVTLENFDETLKDKWASAEVMEKALGKFSELSEAAYEAVQAGKYNTAAEAIEALSGDFDDLAVRAFKSAQEAKSFTEAIDATKDAVSSGWLETFEIIFGNYEEAKVLWTDLANALWEAFASGAEARNEMLQEWKDLGGRDVLIESFWNTWEAIGNIITPIKEAFRDIFPAMTAERLYNITEKLRDLSAGFKEFTGSHGEEIKSIFKGIFSVFGLGIDIIKKLCGGIAKLLGNFSGLGSSVLSITASIGDYISGLKESADESNIFGEAIDKIVEFLQKGIDKIKEFVKALNFKFDTPGFEEFTKLMEKVWDILTTIGSGIKKVASVIGGALSEAFVSGDLKAGLDTLNSGLIAGLILSVTKYMKGITSAFDDNTVGILENLKNSIGKISGIFDSVRDSLQTWQQNLKASTLLKIAAAIGILAAAIFVMSTIDDKKLATSLGAITVLFADLMGSMAIFSKIAGGSKGLTTAALAMTVMSIGVLILVGALKSLSNVEPDKLANGLLGVTVLLAELTAISIIMSKSESKMVKGSVGIILLAVAVKILASACKTFSTMSWEEIGKGLTGVTVLLGALTIASIAISKTGSKMMKGSVGLVLLAAAMKILASACKDFGSMQWSEIGKGLTAIGVLLAEIAIFTKITGNAKHVMSTGLSLVLIAASMKIFASAMKDFGSMQWDEIGRGLVAMGGALLAVAVAVNLMPKNLIGTGIGLITVSAALLILSSALSGMGGMSWEEIGKGMIVFGGSLLILALALNAMKGTIGGAAALIVAATGITILGLALKVMGSMSWESIGKGLLTLGGALAIIGIAGLVLAPVVPALLGLGAAIALIGVGALACGVGLLAFSAGLTALSVSGVAGVSAMVFIFKELISLIPLLLTAVAQGIIEFIQTLGNGAVVIGTAVLQIGQSILSVVSVLLPQIIEVAVTLIDQLLATLAEHMPSIIESGFSILMSILNGIRDHIGEIAIVAADIVMNFITAITEKLPEIVQTGIDLIFSLIEAIGQGIEDNAEKLRNAIISFCEHIINAICNFFGIHSPSTKFAEIGVNLIEGLINGIGGMIEAVVSKVVELGGKLISALGNKVGDFLSKGKAFMTKLGEGISDKVSTVVNKVKDVGSKAVTAIADKASEFKAKGSVLMNNLKTGIQEKLTTVKDKAVDVVSKAISGIEKKKSEFQTIGENMMTGLKNGIENLKGAVTSTVSGIADGVISKFKGLLGIASPSKVFTEFGEYTDIGFINGLNKYSDKVEDASEGIGQKAIDGIGNAISAIDSANITAEPSIRPVMDLSNVGSGNLTLGASIQASLDKTFNPLSDLIQSAQADIGRSNKEVIMTIKGLREDLDRLLTANDQEIALYVDGNKLSSALVNPLNRQLNIISRREGGL